MVRQTLFLAEFCLCASQKKKQKFIRHGTANVFLNINGQAVSLFLVLFGLQFEKNGNENVKMLFKLTIKMPILNDRVNGPQK